MITYIVRRLLQAIPTIFVVATLVFIIFTLVPGDPALMYAGDSASQETVQQLRSRFGLDLPLHERYFEFLKGLVKFDLGSSYFTGNPVWEDVLPRMLNSWRLALWSFMLAVIVGLSVGLVSGAYHGSLGDKLVSLQVLIGISLPNYWIALLLIFFFGVQLRWLPFVGIQGWQSYPLPVIAMSVFSIAFIARMTRSCMIEVLNEDYVRTARAKGLSEKVIIFLHVFRNALVPVVTVLGVRFGYLLGGSVIIESIFAWPGLGYQFVTSVSQRDYPMIRGVMLVFALHFIFITLIMDLVYAFVDPKVRETYK